MKAKKLPKRNLRKLCDNTDCEGNAKNIKKVILTGDFGDGIVKDECNWCKKCRERDEDMIEKTLK